MTANQHGSQRMPQGLVLWLCAKEYKHFAQLVGNTTLEPMVRGAIDRAIAKACFFIGSLAVTID